MQATSLDRLPVELCLAIGSYLKASDLAALLRTSRRYSKILQDVLHDIAVTYRLGPDDGRTVLQWAVEKSEQRAGTLAALVRKGANLYVKNGCLALLDDAARRGGLEATKILVKAGIHPWVSDNDPPLAWASVGGHEALVRYFLYDAMDEWQQGVLQRTTTYEDRSQFLVPYDEQRRQGLEAGLRAAAQGGYIKIVELLCQHISVSDNLRLTFKATEGGSVEIIEILLKLGAKLDPYTLIIAARHGHLQLVEYFISKRLVDVNYYDGTTALHNAVIGGHVDVVQLLLLHGADYEVEDDHEGTALELACELRRGDIIDILGDLPVTVDRYKESDSEDSC